MREGLPQCGVLSPFLWLCYSNDLAPMLRRHAVQVGMYADDIVIYASDRNPHAAAARVQNTLDEIDDWARSWHMKISQEKTKVILFTSNMYEVNSKEKIFICLGDSVIEQVSEIPIVGVTFEFRHTDDLRRAC